MVGHPAGKRTVAASGCTRNQSTKSHSILRARTMIPCMLFAVVGLFARSAFRLQVGHNVGWNIYSTKRVVNHLQLFQLRMAGRREVTDAIVFSDGISTSFHARVLTCCSCCFTYLASYLLCFVRGYRPAIIRVHTLSHSSRIFLSRSVLHQRQPVRRNG